jgi:ABC-type glycerol-3-phosphate transport system substrate-binding protein
LARRTLYCARQLGAAVIFARRAPWRQLMEGLSVGAAFSRRQVLVAAGALGGLTLVACGGQSGAKAPAPEAKIAPGTTISYMGSHNQAEGQLVAGQMQTFEQKVPGVKVETNYFTADYMTKLQTMLASGTPPDMFRTGGTPWAQLANQGAMAEIASRIKRDKYDLTDLIDAAVGQYTWRGKQLGLGSNVGYTLIYQHRGISASRRAFPQRRLEQPMDLGPVQ